MRKILIALALFSVVSAPAALLELKNAKEFKDLISTATVPVIVQFSAYWCKPCQNLKTVLVTVSKDYSDSQVILAYVDADINSSLQTYLLGGYPTVRSFSKGALLSAKFVGSNTESFVRKFIDGVIGTPEDGMDTVAIEELTQTCHN